MKSVGKRRDNKRRRDAKLEKLKSIQMVPRDWLKHFDSWILFKEELKK